MLDILSSKIMMLIFMTRSMIILELEDVSIEPDSSNVLAWLDNNTLVYLYV